MSDLKQYVEKRKARDLEFAENYDAGYLEFKIGVLLRQAREEAGLTQEDVAQKLNSSYEGTLMRNINLFVEDEAHEDFLMALIQRLAEVSFLCQTCCMPPRSWISSSIERSTLFINIEHRRCSNGTSLHPETMPATPKLLPDAFTHTVINRQ